MNEKLQELIKEIIQLRQETVKKNRIIFLCFLIFSSVLLLFIVCIKPIEIIKYDLPETSIMCSSDIFDCEEFANQQTAQFYYQWCLTSGYKDVHNLLQSSNLMACSDTVYGKCRTVCDY